MGVGNERKDARERKMGKETQEERHKVEDKVGEGHQIEKKKKVEKKSWRDGSFSRFAGNAGQAQGK